MVGHAYIHKRSDTRLNDVRGNGWRQKYAINLFGLGKLSWNLYFFAMTFIYDINEVSIFDEWSDTSFIIAMFSLSAIVNIISLLSL